MKTRGIALIVVLLIIVGLLLIAVPFTFSMLLEERESYKNLHNVESIYALETAKNLAISKLYFSHDLYKRQNKFSLAAPYYNTLGEMFIDPRDIKDIDILNYKGTICGINIQDEQGKINLKTAPQRVLNTLFSIIDKRIYNIKDFVTLYSCRGPNWVFPQRIRWITDPPPTKINRNFFYVDDASHFTRGARLRVSKYNLPSLEVVISNPQVLETVPLIPKEYEGGIVELEYRHPVNVNTAPLEVLVAIFEGIYTTKMVKDGKSLVSQDHNITREEAYTIANTLCKSRPYKSLRKVVETIKNIKLGEINMNPLAVNVVDPTNVILENNTFQSTGTVPLCVKSYNTFTIEPTTSINSPAGTEWESKSYREVVSITPPLPARFVVESQYDFENFLGGVWAYTLGQQANFPFGNKIITLPNCLEKGVEPDTLLKPNSAYLQMLPAEDERGSAQYINYREHFRWDSPYARDTSNPIEGVKAPLYYDWNKAFFVPPNQPDISGGGMEMWVKFDDSPANGCCLFDIRESNFENRLTLEYKQGKLVLTACDATLEKSQAQIEKPFNPSPGIWYHIGAYWKSTCYGLLALLVDGFADGSIFSYIDASGKRTTNLPDGYSTRLRNIGIAGGQIDRITKGGSTLATVFGINTTTSLFAPSDDKIDSDGDESENDPDISHHHDIGINEKVTDIPVSKDGAKDFPSEGYILIGREVIRYNGKSNAKTCDWFKNCQRGQMGTTISSHNNGDSVSLFAIKVSSNKEYLNPCIIQIDDEWFGPVQKFDVDYFTGIIQNGQPVQLGRGYGGTEKQAHVGGAMIIPVFGISGTANRDDKVTIIDGNNNKEEQTLRVIKGSLAAFYNNVTR